MVHMICATDFRHTPPLQPPNTTTYTSTKYPIHTIIALIVVITNHCTTSFRLSVVMAESGEIMGFTLDSLLMLLILLAIQR